MAQCNCGRSGKYTGCTCNKWQFDEVGQWATTGRNYTNNWPYYQPYTPSYKEGWVCPKCGKVHAPWAASCTCHVNINYPITVTAQAYNPDVIKVHFQVYYKFSF